MAWAVTFGTPAALQILCTHFRGQSRQCSPKSAALGSRARRTRYGGILAHGFVLARCRDCGWCRPVAFSCRRRIRRRARRLGIKSVLKTGAVTVIQRFNSALGASPRFHTLFLDGVYSFTLGRAPVFHPTPGPTDEDVALVAASVFRRVTRKLAGEEPSPAHQDFIETAPLLAAISQAVVGGASATTGYQNALSRPFTAPVTSGLIRPARAGAHVPCHRLTDRRSAGHARRKPRPPRPGRAHRHRRPGGGTRQRPDRSAPQPRGMESTAAPILVRGDQQPGRRHQLGRSRGRDGQ